MECTSCDTIFSELYGLETENSGVVLCPACREEEISCLIAMRAHNHQLQVRITELEKELAETEANRRDELVAARFNVTCSACANTSNVSYCVSCGRPRVRVIETTPQTYAEVKKELAKTKG